MTLATDGPFPLQSKSTTDLTFPSSPTRNNQSPPGDDTPLGTPSYSHNQPTRQSLTVAVGGAFARVRFRADRPQGPREWVRGDVQRFSARSRSRLLQMFARTDLRRLPTHCTFTTLTYHLTWADDAATWHNQIEEWDRRVRRAHPGSWSVWRLEFQERGAPHFHVLTFSWEPIPESTITEEWHDIGGRCCEWCDRYMVRVDPIETWEQASRYASKYEAKVDETIIDRSSGRVWGVKGRKNRVETLYEVELSEAEAFAIRRIFKRIIRVANGYYRPGGTRSGVWVRCTNQTAKRALEWVSSALGELSAGITLTERVLYDDDGRPPDGMHHDSTRAPGAAGRTTFGRTNGTPTLPLFDRLDVQRRWAASQP